MVCVVGFLEPDPTRRLRALLRFVMALFWTLDPAPLVSESQGYPGQRAMAIGWMELFPSPTLAGYHADLDELIRYVVEVPSTFRLFSLS